MNASTNNPSEGFGISWDPSLVIGQGRLSQWKLIGVGGQSQVYSAFDTTLHRSVAVKIRHLEPVTDPDPRKKRLYELHRLLVLLKHPSIVQVLDVIQTATIFATVETLCTGPSLESRIQSGGVSLGLATRWFQQIVQAVRHLHEHDLLHCDLKLSNVMLDEDERAQLIDFDLCRPLGSKSYAATATQGTLAYLAPEILGGQAPHSIASEVYALGIILYELLTSQSLAKLNPQAVRTQIAFDKSFRDKFVNKSAAHDWETIIRKAMHINPDSRYNSCSALLLDVANVSDGKPISARPRSSFEIATDLVRRAPLLSGLVCLTFIIVAVGSMAAVLAWKNASRIQTQAEASTQELEKNIRDLNAAKLKLNGLIAEITKSNQATSIAEKEAQEQLTQSLQAQRETEVEADRARELAEAALEAKRIADSSKVALLDAEEQRTVEAENLAKQNQLTANMNYFRKFRDAWKLVEEAKWQEARDAAEDLPSNLRGIEYRMLLGAIENQSTEPTKVDIATLTVEHKQLLLTLANETAVIGNHLQSRVMATRNEKHMKIASQPWLTSPFIKVSIEGMTDPLIRIECGVPCGILSDGSILTIRTDGRGKRTLECTTFWPAATRRTFDDFSDKLNSRDLFRLCQLLTYEIETDLPTSKEEPNQTTVRSLPYDFQRNTEFMIDGEKLRFAFLGRLKVQYAKTDLIPLMGGKPSAIAIRANGLIASCYDESGSRLIVTDLENRLCDVMSNGIAAVVAIDRSGDLYFGNPDSRSFRRCEISNDLEQGKVKITAEPQPPAERFLTFEDQDYAYRADGWSIDRKSNSRSTRERWFRVNNPTYGVSIPLMLSANEFLLNLRNWDAVNRQQLEACILVDRELRGFYVIDGLKPGDSFCKTNDGKKMYKWVEGKLVPFTFVPVPVSLVPMIDEGDYWRLDPKGDARAEIRAESKFTALQIQKNGSVDQDNCTRSPNVKLFHGKEYRVSISASSRESAWIRLKIVSASNGQVQCGLDQRVQLSTEIRTDEFTFVANNPNGDPCELVVEFGTATGEIRIADIQLLAM